MRIGILTWYFGANYGARAHSYALQQVLCDMGHTSEMIRYIPKGVGMTNVLMNLNLPGWKRLPVKSARCFARCLILQQQLKAYKLSKRVYSAQEIDALGYDLIILGSDEIFKVDHPFCCDVYFGVGFIKTPTILYAPSSGQTNERYKLSDKRCLALSRALALSARDHYTARLLLYNCGRDARIVLDPTFLYSFKMLSWRPSREKYLLMYSFSPWDEYSRPIRQYAASRGYVVACVGRYCNWADTSADLVDLDRWMACFASAEAVITDSFHGMIFAIKHQKPFMVLGRGDKINKIRDLLALLGIDKGFYDGSTAIADEIECFIDYQTVNRLLEENRLASMDYLTEGIAMVLGGNKNGNS
jgi:hypothetical protein